jgi:protein SCO1/2
MKINSDHIVMTAIAIAAMFIGLWLANTVHQPKQLSQPPRIQGAIYPTAKPIQPFQLVNHMGTAFTINDFKNKWSLIFVGYTHCPDICPTTLAMMSQIHSEMSNQNLIAPNIVFLSIDPERDTADKMKQYIEYFNKEFVGLTGDLEQVNQLSRNLNAVYRKAPGLSGKITDDDYLMDHSSALMLINPNGNLQAMLTAPHTQGAIIQSVVTTQNYFSQVH